MTNYNVGRKGQAGSALGGLLGVALLVIILIVSVTIGSQITQTITANEAGTTNRTVVNETVNSSINSSAYNGKVVLSQRKPVNAVLSIRNGSGNVIDTGNYTVDFSQATINFSAANPYSGAALNITYHYDGDTESAARNISRKGNEALQNFSNFWIPMVLIVIAGAIIALIFGMFMAARR